jgi:hypothetical protein
MSGPRLQRKRESVTMTGLVGDLGLVIKDEAFVAGHLSSSILSAKVSRI